MINIWNRSSHFVGIMSNSLFSLCLHSYVLSSSGKLELGGWGSGERKKHQGGSGYDAGAHFMALGVSEKYQSQIQWPLQRLEISIAFRLSKHRSAMQCSLYLLCVCVCVCVCACARACVRARARAHILVLWIFSVYFGMFVFNLCLCRVYNTSSPPQHKTSS